MFYPKGRLRPRGFDELTFYAEHFNTVEVNSTFYGQPRADVCRGWAARTPDDFEFSVKLYQKFTHPRMFEERVVKSLPEDARDDREAVRARDGTGRVRIEASAEQDDGARHRGVDDERF